jgi:uncharacterized membrane protein
MNAGNYLLALLTLHLTGLVLMAGTTIVDYLTFKTLIKLFDDQKEKLTGLINLTAKFSRLIGIGAALLILTGFGMMALTKGVFGEQLWFRIKFALVIILVANAIVFGRQQGLKFRKLIADDAGDNEQKLGSAVNNLNLFYTAQLLIFAVIIILSVFKFN